MTEKHIGRYRILETIASGSQGAVYRAFDVENSRIVALKVLHKSLTTDGQFLERFQREASLMTSLDHPNVVELYDVGTEDGSPYLAMELIPENLGRVMEASGQLPIASAINFATQIAEGLSAAHAAGIIHRDIKPQNVLIDTDGVAKVTDFGIARGEMLATMTATGVIMGTPYYMSPEQAEGGNVDARSDLYSLGCVLYQMLSGKVVFEATSPLAVLRMHIDKTPTPLSELRDDVPKELVSIVDRSLAKDPSDRYQTAAAMAMDLAAVESRLRRASDPASSRGKSPERLGGGALPPYQLSDAQAPRSSRIASFSRYVLIAIGMGAIGLIAGFIIRSGNSNTTAEPVAQTVTVETVIVERQVAGETVIETVVVEREVAGQTVIETVLVERQVPGETIIQTVVVERVVTEQVVQTVIVERLVEIVVTATAVPIVAAAPGAPLSTGNPEGSVVQAIRRVNSIYGVAYTGPYRGSAHQQTGGVEEFLFVMGSDGNPMTPQLAESWSVNPAGTNVTITMKTGIPWHAPLGDENLDATFGNLVAQDIVDWLNTSNSTTNPESTYPDAGDFAAVFLEARAVDNATLEIGLVSPVFYGLPLSQFGILGAARGPSFVRGVDIMGLDWAQANAVGTGPFRQGLCIPGDRCTANALSEHWRRVADVSSITVIQVPEPQTRIAMLRNGQIDMSEMDFKLVPGLIDEGFQFLDTQPGNFIGQSIVYAGNLWEEGHARTGEALNPWDAPPYDEDFAWIGDPWQESNPGRVRYTDTNNPPGMTDMEQARLVRLALGTAIDRQQINDVLLGGLGVLLYSEYMGPEYPGWDPNRDTGVWSFDGRRRAASGTQQSIPYVLADGDLIEADRLLTVAGYPTSSRRDNFGDSLTLQKYPAEAGEVGLEIGDTINSTWSQLGISVSQLVEDYGGVISPRLRKREQFLPVLKNGDVNANVFPLDWPYPAVDSSISRPGWGIGFETPYLSAQHFSIRGSQDRAFREEEHMNTVDYMLYWQLYNGVYQIPRGVVASDRIASWANPATHYGGATGANAPEFLILRR